VEPQEVKGGYSILPVGRWRQTRKNDKLKEKYYRKGGLKGDME
jgi:hypothetical protein